MEASHLIVGCGYLGRVVARQWQEQGHTVAALTRGRTTELQSLGLLPIIGDVTEPQTLKLPPVRTVLYAVGLDRRAGKSMREVYVQGLSNVLDALPACEQLIYVSSTSVYGQTDGSWVDETSPTQPIEESGLVVLEAEQTLRHRRFDAIILRFSGIYGPHRILRRAAIERGEPLQADADKWLNLIHVDDGARAVLAAERSARPGETYIVSDGTPMTRRDFYTEVARVLGAPEAQFEPGPASSSRESNRRMSNQKIRQECAMTFQYSSYREGLRASLRAEQQVGSV